MSLEDRFYPLLAAYDRLPDPLQFLIGGLYRALPRRMRWGAAYPEFRRLARDVENWSLDEIRAYQIKELRRVLHHAANYCPYYQQKFSKAAFRPESIQDLQDLEECPLLEKREVIEHREQMVSAEIPRKQRLYLTTGGSTGVPVGFYLQKGISRPKEQAFLETMWERAGYFRNARVAVIRGHTITDKAAGRISRYDATRNWLLLSSSHMTRERMPEYLEALERFRPHLLHAYPSAALQIAEYLETSNQGWRIPLRALLCGSERLTLSQKRMLERVFKCRVYRWYGHSERVVLAGEGRESELFYFFPQYGIAEFGPPDAEGFCEVIGTSLHNLAMPLIRYRTGDLVRLADPRVDGELEFPWPAVAEVVGREQEFLITAAGRRISLTAFNMHDGVFDDLYAVQFYQEQPGVAEFRYVPGPNFRTARLPQIEERLHEKLGDDFQVSLTRVIDVEKTARGKHRWLVSRLGNK